VGVQNQVILATKRYVYTYQIRDKFSCSVEIHYFLDSTRGQITSNEPAA